MAECRQLALDAAERQDYNAFHDLAWRALQPGPKNDPSLMLMLARAQSLSGRPHDALVMLQRLVAMGVATDAATNDDFRFVRALPAWADFEAKVSGNPAPTRIAETTPPSVCRPTGGARPCERSSRRSRVTLAKPEPNAERRANGGEPLETSQGRLHGRHAAPGRLIFQLPV